MNDFRRVKIVVAIPTIVERDDAWEQMARQWRRRTCQPVVCEPSWRPGGWAAGLNEVWEKHLDADIFVCGSDDMYPEDDYWLPACEPFLAQDRVIAPQVRDPRFDRWDSSTSNGEVTRMSSFPILPGAVLAAVFPLPDELHYYSDDLISDKARKAGFETVAVPSCVIVHTFDERGRGAGMGSEEVRMIHDRKLYRALSA